MRARRALLRAAAAAGLGYLLVAGGLFAFQRRLLFPVPATAIRPYRDVVHIPGPNGPLYGLWRRAPEGAPTVVCFHGNGEQLASLEWLVEQLSKRGLGAAAVEYPGYGLSKNEPLSEVAIEQTAAAYLQWMGEKGLAKESMVLEGWSLGSGVAAQMAVRGFGSRLVLVSAFTSIPDVAQRLYPFLPARLLVRDPFDTLVIAPEIPVPVLLVHGANDGLVPPPMSEQLSRRFPHAERVVIPGRGHDDIFDDPAVLDRIAAFAKGAGATEPSAQPGR